MINGHALCRNDKTDVFLILGDGDFSFSVDLATFFRQEKQRRATTIHATGLDSQTDLYTKYKDAKFLLSLLKSDDFLRIEVYHGVNAAAVKPENTLVASHVIFNHPHLATEDAQRHSRFLAHFFHTSNSTWMAPGGGLLHLTLAIGQCDRWKCTEMAERQGLLLVARHAFVPPPVTDPKYQHRRHQSGKSFSKRTSGSETITFARISEHSLLSSNCLPWQQQHRESEKEENAFPCPECDKIFSEERARMSHAKAVHWSKKRQRETYLVCVHCPERTFLHDEALQDHIRAKHSVHTKILPEWAAENKQANVMTHIVKVYGECSICGFVYHSLNDEECHAKEFTPQNKVAGQGSDKSFALYNCSLCCKHFIDKRAQLQHEIFCSSKSGDSTEMVKQFSTGNNTNITHWPKHNLPKEISRLSNK